MTNRELDRAVAEALGWRRIVEDPAGYWEGRSPTNLLSLVLEEVPHYSTDIAAAWAAVDHLVARGWCFKVECCLSIWQCVWLDMKIEGAAGKATAETAAEAICRAVIAALGEQP